MRQPIGRLAFLNVFWENISILDSSKLCFRLWNIACNWCAMRVSSCSISSQSTWKREATMTTLLRGSVAWARGVMKATRPRSKRPSNSMPWPRPTCATSIPTWAPTLRWRKLFGNSVQNMLLWIRPEHDSPGPKFTLNAADSHIGMAKPSRPFGMMLHGRPGKSEKGFPDSRPGFSKQEWFPTVKTILEEMRKKSSRVYQVVKEAKSNSWWWRRAGPRQDLKECSLQSLDSVRCRNRIIRGSGLAFVHRCGIFLMCTDPMPLELQSS